MKVRMILIALLSAAAILPPASATNEQVVVYGESVETVEIKCHPMAHCLVELPPNERVDFSFSADQKRWHYTDSGYADTAVVIARPKDCKPMSTSLTIGTDKGRRYEVKLLSSCEYEGGGRITWKLPSGLISSGTARILRPAAAPKMPPMPQVVTVKEVKNFRYRVKARGGAVAPVEVYDDGRKTYLKIGEDGEIPALTDGRGGALDASYVDGVLVVAGVHDVLKLRYDDRRFGPRLKITRRSLR